MSWWERQWHKMLSGSVTVGGTLTANALAGAAVNYSSWTPTYAASGSMTYGTVTLSRARYAVIGKTLIASVRTTAGTTGGTASDAVLVSVPSGITLVDNGALIGCLIKEAGAIKAGFVGRGSATQLAVIKSDASNWGLAADTWFGFTFIGEIS